MLTITGGILLALCIVLLVLLYLRLVVLTLSAILSAAVVLGAVSIGVAYYADLHRMAINEVWTLVAFFIVGALVIAGFGYWSFKDNQ